MIQHIISEYRLRAYEGPMTEFLEASPNALGWIKNVDVEI